MKNETNKYQANPPSLILSPSKQILCRSELLGQSFAELRVTHMLAAHPATAYTATARADIRIDRRRKNIINFDRIWIILFFMRKGRTFISPLLQSAQQFLETLGFKICKNINLYFL